MKKIPLSRRRVILIIVGLIVIYFLVPFPFLSEGSRADVHEACIRWLFHHNASALQDKLQVCFVGIGTTFDPMDKDCDPHDPPKEFVDRFADFAVPVFPVSQSARAGPSGPGYIDSPDGGIFPHVVDSAGRPGLIFGAGNVKRWSLGVAVCRGYYFEAGLSAGGYEILVLRLPFLWVPVWARMLWIS
jgi:hypothetical protein